MVGGEGDDILIGNSRDNLLDGRNGSDIEQGAAGDDTYVFVPGNPGDNDQLVETIGSDTLDFSRIPDPVIGRSGHAADLYDRAGHRPLGFPGANGRISRSGPV